MAHKAVKQQDGNEQPASSPFVTAVHFALADTDIAQTELFDRMLGKPRTAEGGDAAARHAPTPSSTKQRTKKSPHKQGVDDGDGPVMSLDDFLVMVRGDVDYRPNPIMPSDLRAQLEAFRQDFIDSVLGAKDLPGLLKNLEKYVAKEHERLFYQTNDFMSASIKYDYFSQFMDKLCIHLREVGQLDTDQLNRIEDLEKIYKLGLNTYNLAGKKLFTATQGDTRSILAQAARIRDSVAERADADGKQDTTTLEEHAHAVMQQLLFSAYGIKSKNKVPPPLLITLATLTETLARSQLQAMNPHLDFRDPELASGEMVMNRYSELLDTWKDRVKGKPSPQQMYGVYIDLVKQIQHFQQLPENFSDLIEAATKAAEKETANKIPRIFAEHQKMKQIPVPRAQKMIDALHPSFDTDENLTENYWRFKRRMRELKKAEDKYELIEFIEEKLDLTAEEIALYGSHPAMALVAKEYVAAFRKHLGAALYDAKRHDERFLISLKELENKADLIHENQREISHWLMQDTDGGHDNQFHYTLMSLGSDTTPISDSDVERIADHASDGLTQAAEHRGIPPSLSGVQYMPLIYARCRDIAQAEVGRYYTARRYDFDTVNAPQPAKEWVDNVTATRKLSAGKTQAQYDEREPLTPQEQELLKAVRVRTLALFNQAMCCLLPEDKRTEIAAAEAKADQADETQALADKGAPTSKPSSGEGATSEADKVKADADEPNDHFADYAIELTAHNLRRVMEFLDHIDRGKDKMQMH